MSSYKKAKGAARRPRSGTATTARRTPGDMAPSVRAGAGSATRTPTEAGPGAGKTVVRQPAVNTAKRRSRMSRYARRRRLQTRIAGGVIVLAAVAALAFFLWPRGTPTKPSAQTSACTTTARTGLDGTPAAAGGPAAVNGKLETLQDCLQYIDIKVGSGATVKAGDKVTVSYTGWLTNGSKFDASADHPGQPFSFTVGNGEVIPGWDKGLVGMKVGGSRRLIIPPALGYGATGSGPIPPNATLLFDVTVVSIG